MLVGQNSNEAQASAQANGNPPCARRARLTQDQEEMDTSTKKTSQTSKDFVSTTHTSDPKFYINSASGTLDGAFATISYITQTFDKFVATAFGVIKKDVPDADVVQKFLGQRQWITDLSGLIFLTKGSFYVPEIGRHLNISISEYDERIFVVKRAPAALATAIFGKYTIRSLIMDIIPGDIWAKVLASLDCECRFWTCAQICAVGRNLPIYKGDNGGIVCCAGTKCACAWREDFPELNKCAQVHEDYHHSTDATYCDPNKCLYAPLESARTREYNKCYAYWRTYQCMREEEDKATDPEKRQRIRDEIENNVQKRIDEYCK